MFVLQFLRWFFPHGDAYMTRGYRDRFVDDEDPFLGACTRGHNGMRTDDAFVHDPPPFLQSAAILATRVRDAVVSGAEDCHSVQDVFCAEWSALCTALEVERGSQFTGWSAFDRARCFEILIALRAYGFTATIPDVVMCEPSDVDARYCWLRAMQGPAHARIPHA